jgi:hypothetical protein
VNATAARIPLTIEVYGEDNPLEPWFVAHTDGALDALTGTIEVASFEIGPAPEGGIVLTHVRILSPDLAPVMRTLYRDADGAPAFDGPIPYTGTRLPAPAPVPVAEVPLRAPMPPEPAGAPPLLAAAVLLAFALIGFALIVHYGWIAATIAVIALIVVAATARREGV